MACGWAEEPGADERFGAWAQLDGLGGQHHANLIPSSGRDSMLMMLMMLMFWQPVSSGRLP